MRLKRLELFGFKSFADRTVLDFQNALTGIVGPNGCGKSNVVDAVRWVLGEQRPTSMRGGEMADVIFKGSVSRPSMAVAEVTMVLDNAAGTLPDRGAEVSITRRVFSSGEGEYLLGGERVRLKDVRDMLFDTGLGSRGYAVLEQGRIDAVLSANPLDRRAIFEEAAGISRYRQRKKESEARLKRVEQDVLRLDDVLRELATRVRSLKIQAGKAERYVAARDAWRESRGRAARHRLVLQRAELAALGAEIGGLEQEAERLRTLRAAEEGDVGAREREQLSLASEVDRLADQVARLSGEGRAADERHAQLTQRIGVWRASAADESRRALELASQLEMREAELERLQGEALERRQALDAVRVLVEANGRELREARGAHRGAREASEEANARVLEALHGRTEAANTVRHLEASRGPLRERGERLRQRFEESLRAVEALKGQASGAEQRLAVATEELQRTAAHQAGLAEQLARLEGDARALEQRRSELEVGRARLGSRIDALRDWEREREGLDAGARALLEGVDSGAGPCTAAELAGVVADRVRTSTRYARALDAALGAEALALLVRDSSLFARAAAWLAERKAGQARLFAPPAAGLPGAGAPLDALSAAERARVLGPLLAELEVDAGFEPLAAWLLGDVLLVERLEDAQALVAAHPQLRCVTPRGDLFDACGAVVGYREIAQGAAGRRASASELERELEAVVAELAGLAERGERLAAELLAAREQGRAAQREHEAARGALAEAQTAARTAHARLVDLEQAHALHARESEAAAAEAARLEQALAEVRERLARAEAHFAERNSALQELEQRRGACETRVDALQRAAGKAELDLTRVRAELEGREQRIEDLQRACREAGGELERARRLAREHEESATAAARECVAVRQESDRLLEERGRTEQRLDELRRTERAGREAIETYRRRLDAVTRELEALAARVAERRLVEQRVALARAELAGRVLEDLGRSEDDLLEGFTPEAGLEAEGALDALDAEVGELKRKLDALGPVNTDAVAELEEAQARFDFLDSQRRDLAAAQATLEDTLETINQESVRLFLETFEEVRGHFQTLFRQLFGGGRADLSLQEGVDPLEAGIDISARPPGREMLPIGLLSGGQRTMTALALLFAVFRSRPSPFCVLDEVDAALDDANVGRFLSMVDSFLGDTQFIVVTHNKGTMAACQALYGITMETKGVSSHVSVEFGDVDRYVPEATGNAAVAEEERRRVESAAEAAESPASDAEPTVELQPWRPEGNDPSAAPADSQAVPSNA